MQPDVLRCARTANVARDEPAGTFSRSGDVRSTRVLYSFPHRIGAGRICHTAWEQAAGASAAGVDIHVVAAAVARELPERVKVTTTLARGPVRLPYRVVGQLRAIKLHDRIVARLLPRLASEIDIVHTWPLGALETLRTARRLGIATVLERPNAHTRFAYEIVQKECDRLGVPLPRDHEHAYNEDVLRREEEEYRLADYLLCPSDFVVKTFLDQNVSGSKLVRHTYGFDEAVYYPSTGPERCDSPGLVVLYVGVAAVRKGLHFALEAWLRSPASRDGTFLIAGEFLPAYAGYLAASLAHPSVRVLGHRTDVPELMRGSDVLILPTIEEGFGLVCAEALGSGCVPLVSDACTEVCRHGENALVHSVGDVDALESHLTALHDDPDLLQRLREGALRSAPNVTWSAAGRRLSDVYRDVICNHLGESHGEPRARAGLAG